MTRTYMSVGEDKYFVQKFDWFVKSMWFAVFVKTYDDNIEIQYLKMLKKRPLK